MRKDREQFSSTLSELRELEVMDRRPGRIQIHVADAQGQRSQDIGCTRFTVGSHADNAVVVHDVKVSKVHFELQATGYGGLLRDLDSTNGTWAGGIRLHSAVVPTNTTIKVGDSTVTITGVAEVDVPVSLSAEFRGLHGKSSCMGELFATLDRLRNIPLDVLIQGETGTGKEAAARSLQLHADQPFVVVDCATLKEEFAEADLFGHGKGAYTGATDHRLGLLEEANGGTIFFDEIAELPMSLQPRLLRALQERCVRRVGENNYRKFHARTIAATHRDLVAMVAAGRFREDLYFRLQDVEVMIPPLRSRGKDISLLADRFLDQIAQDREDGTPRHELDNSAYRALNQHLWPGNVRELESVMRRAAYMTDGKAISAKDLRFRRPQQHLPGAPAHDELEGVLSLPFDEARQRFEGLYFTRCVQLEQGNKSAAARRAGVSRTTLLRHLP